MNKGICIHSVKLPESVNGCTVANDNGTFDIYINSAISEERQAECKKALVIAIQN